MKMRGKILLIIVLPILILSTIVNFISYYEMQSIALKELKMSLETSAKLMISSYELEIDGPYHQKEDGTYWKGDTLNISENTDVVDQIAENGNMAATFIMGNVRAMTSIKDENGNRIIGTEIDDKIYEKLQKGENVFVQNLKIAGKRYEAFYMPVYQENSDTEIIGSVFVASSSENLNKSVNNAISLIIIILLLVVVVSIVVGWLVVNKIIRVLHKGMGMVENVSKGNLVTQLEDKYLTRKDEAGQISRAINSLREKLQKMFGNIFENSSQLLQTSIALTESAQNTETTVAQVEKAVQEIAEGATSQAEETQKASEQVSVMGDKITETAHEVENLNRNAKEMQKSSDEAMRTMKELSSINEKAKEAIYIIYDQTNTTNDSAIKIKEATNLITSIAEETNLLSLNASIEAARAGEQGRGFAVVASQIQKLAEQSNESAQKIEEIILSLLEDSGNAVKTMDEVKVIMDNQSENLARTSENFAQVKQGIDHSINGISNISELTEELNQLKVNVIDIVQALSSIAQQNAASVQETSAAATEVSATVETLSDTAKQLEAIAEGLEKSISAFQIK